MNCTGVTVSGSEFVLSNQETKFNFYKNCSTTSLLEVSQLSNSNSTFTFTANTVVGKPKFDTGVYLIEVVITDLNGNITTHTSCKFLDCDSLSCTLLGNYLTDTDKVLAYQGLVLANECLECSCSKLCKLLNFINTDDTTGCGCG